MSRQSDMTPVEFRHIVDEVYGPRRQGDVAKDIGRCEVTVSRWLNGVTPIGEVEALALRLIYMAHKMRIDWRLWLRDYQPKRALTLEDL